MKRPLGLALAASLLLVLPAARADEPPYLDFVHGLREKHYTDLALEYLHKLQQRKDLSADVAARLPLEIARAQLDQAGDTPDLGQRLALYNEARRHFETFLAKNPNSPLVNQARFDLARVAVRQGRTQLSRALREEDAAARNVEAVKARQLLADAGKQLEAVLPLLDKQVKDYPEVKNLVQRAEKKELEDSYTRARLDVALNLYDQARTYLDTGKVDEAKLRADLLDKAIATLTKSLPEDERNPIYWEAQAWLGRFLDENGNTDKARSKFNEVLAERARYADTGHRLARYFRMLLLMEAGDPSIKDRWKEIRDDAGRWLREYAAFANTPEGFGVRYALAQADIQIGNEQKTRFQRGQLYAEAKALCKDLSEVENDFQVKARKIKIRIFEEEGGLKADVGKMTTFDDCYVRAQYEGTVLEDGKEGDKPLTPEQRSAHEKTLVKALERALDLAGKQQPKVSQADRDNARAMLAFAYMTGGKLLDAIRVGEELARVPTRPPQSARAAIYAMHSYVEVITDPDKAKVPPDEVKEYKDRLRSLAEFAKKNWPNEAPGDVARHELGLLDIREGNYPAAVEELSSIHPGYSGGIVAHYQLALAALDLQRNGAKPPAGEKRSYEQRAVEALEKMPPLPEGGADPATNYYFVMGKVRLGDIYYRAKKYDAMAALADPLLARLGKLTFPGDKLTEEARSGLSTVSLLARYGKASEDYNANRFDAVIKSLEPLLSQARSLPEFQTNPRLRWALLGLLLRSEIQKGKLAEGQKVLDVLQALSSGNELEGGANALLTQVAQLLKEQVQEIRRKAPDQLPKTVETFSKFLDRLTEQQEKKKALTPEALLILSNCYSTLDNHKRAADMLGAFPKPADDAPQKDRDAYQVIQVMYLRELRLGNQIEDARKKFDELIKTSWGPRNLELQKEKWFLQMADKHWMPAARGWDGLVKNLVPKINQPGMKEQYLECYYWLVYCLNKHVQELPEGRQSAALKSTANFIVQLEKNWPDFGTEASKVRFQDLLDKESALKEEYEKLKTSR